jgi:hypothetical protein
VRHRSGRLIALSLFVVVAGAAAAQYVGSRVPERVRPFRPRPNAPYDGRFTFMRANYTTAPGGYWYRGLPAWAHGYPLAEQNLMRIMKEVSLLNGHTEEINSVSLDDPELFRYPVAYVIEVGWWQLQEAEVAALRSYLAKGGFVIVDDFKPRAPSGLGGWDVFAENMQRVVPNGRFVDLTAAHPIFHSFFEINALDRIPQAYVPGRPIFRGLFEDNDPTKRLQMIVNYNTDISQFWEWSGTGLRPIDQTNEAYKLGVNYLIYGMTH